MWLYTLFFYYLVVLEYVSSCGCNHSNYVKGETGTLLDSKDKRQLPPFEDYGSVEFIMESDLDVGNSTVNNYVLSNVTARQYLEDLINSENAAIKQLKKKIEDNVIVVDNVTSTRQTSTETTVTTDSSLNDHTPMSYCEKYKSAKKFELRKMADVWKIEFYTIPSPLKCFRLHLKRVTPSEQQRYERLYGDFDDRVRWADCIIEIRSSDSRMIRKHFLQNSGCGVMDNIIIEQDQTTNGNSAVLLQEESPDQWYMVKNMLLMRDCSTGDIAVFSRVPSTPSLHDIRHALMEFGEPFNINGTRACQGYIKAWAKGKLIDNPLRYS